MQTHDDADAHDVSRRLDALRELGETMTARGANRLTAGAPGERLLLDFERMDFAIQRLPNDPVALRISIGEVVMAGAEDFVSPSCYLVFRGNPKAIVSLLRRALTAIEGAV